MTHAELRDRIGLTTGLPDYTEPDPSKIVYPPMTTRTEKQYISILTRKYRRDFWIWFGISIVTALAFVASVYNVFSYYVK
jgi:hypothetical protein